MSEKSPNITHPGTIQNIEGNKIYVKILAQSACSTCHAKGSCSVSDMTDKIIEIISFSSDQYKTGDKVTVSMKQSLGNRAIFFAYFLPFLCLFACLIILLAITNNELLAGLVSVGILVPYYAGLYLLRDRMGKVFQFELTQ